MINLASNCQPPIDPIVPTVFRQVLSPHQTLRIARGSRIGAAICIALALALAVFPQSIALVTLTKHLNRAFLFIH